MLHLCINQRGNKGWGRLGRTKKKRTKICNIWKNFLLEWLFNVFFGNNGNSEKIFWQTQGKFLKAQKKLNRSFFLLILWRASEPIDNDVMIQKLSSKVFTYSCSLLEMFSNYESYLVLQRACRFCQILGTNHYHLKLRRVARK